MHRLNRRARWLAALLLGATIALAAEAPPPKQQTRLKDKGQTTQRVKQKPDGRAQPQTKRSVPAATPDQQSPSPAAMPVSPPATAECSIDAVAETGPVSYKVPIPVPGSQRRVAECLIPASRAIALAAKGDLLLVDTRHPGDFEQYRLPGALNIPLSFVKTKAFLKQKSFVLVNEGRSSSALETACKELRAAGFKHAAVLRAGLVGWRGAKGAIDGDLLAQRNLTRLRPVELAEEAGYDDWVVLSVATTPAVELKRFLPQAIPLTAKDDGLLAGAAKSALAKHSRKGIEPKVLIVDEDGSRAERIEVALQGKLAQPVFVLEGGLAAYRRFWTEQAAIWATLDRGPRRPRCGA